ncbi:MAG: hypothetical protein SVM80_02750 [Halobacteriota archaeon]|nr:hypothetical protein [Halobacteriota archaeon]
MPKDIAIYAIEVETVDLFGEELTEEVKRAIPKVVEMIINDLKDRET